VQKHNAALETASKAVNKEGNKDANKKKENEHVNVLKAVPQKP
jgi:hypothetical protein